MESELYRKVYQLVMKIANGRTIKKATFFDADIVLTYLWAVLHDRPIYWACDKKNWPIYYRRKPLPTASTMTRRLRKKGIRDLFKEVEQSLLNHFPPSLCRWIDAKPLPIGGASKDKQSAFGFSVSSLAKGYKLYAIADKNQGFVRWIVRSMDHSETKVARILISSIDNQGYLIGDGLYDKNHLYDKAGEKSMQLLTPQRIQNARGLGHRRHSLYRIRAMELIKSSFGQSLLESRKGIERMFGNLTCFAGGLKPLPHWVRTLFRVRMWVRAKMILYHLWRLENHERKYA
jgi:hypothetical protein